MSIQQKIIPSIVLVSGAVLLAAFAALNGAEGVTASGRTAFEKRCTGCHALDHEKVGPRLAGVVGRRAGSITGFPYSDGFKRSALVWSEAALDKWLTDPESLIPDTDMTFRLDNAAERAAIIAFLKETTR